MLFASVQPIMGWLVGLLFAFSAVSVQAQEVAIFDARKTLPLSPDEPVHQDFYLNAGTEVGLRPGTIVTVKRRTSLYDAYQNRSPGDLLVPVGDLRVIHSQKGLSVARLHEMLPRKNLPILEIDFIMVGDRLDMSSARAGSEKASASNDSVPAPSSSSVQEAKVEVQSATFSSQAPPNPPAPAEQAPVSAPLLQ